MIAGEPAAIQFLQPKEVQTLGNDVAAICGCSEKDSIEAMLADSTYPQVRVCLGVPRILAVLGFAQKLPDV